MTMELIDPVLVGCQEGFIGIDPGVTGAIAFISSSGHASVFDAPTILIPIGTRRRSQLLERAAADLIRNMTAAGLEGVDPPGRWKAGIEWAQATPILRAPKKGVELCSKCGYTPGYERAGTVSAFSYGQNFGTWLGILATLKIPTIKIRPQQWKAAMLAGYSARDKDAARAVAFARFPGVELGRRKDAGRAEALLIAEMTRRLEGGER